jgi:hypothetical protein
MRIGIKTFEVLGELLVDEISQVTAVVEDHVQGFAASETSNCLLDTPVIFLFGLALPGENGHTSRGDARGPSSTFELIIRDQIQHIRCSGVVLGGENVLAE